MSQPRRISIGKAIAIVLIDTLGVGVTVAAAGFSLGLLQGAMP